MSAKNLILAATASLSIPFAANAGMIAQVTTIDGFARVPTQSDSFGPDTVTGASPVSDAAYAAAPFVRGLGVGVMSTPVIMNMAQSSVTASSQGVFALETRGNIQYSAQTHVNNNFLYQNDTSVDMDYTLRLFLTAGQLSTSLSGDNNGQASYSMNVSRDGQTKYYSAVNIYSNGNYLENGSRMDNVDIFSSPLSSVDALTYSWTDTWIDISLGTLAAGETMYVNYDFLIAAMGDFGSSAACNSLPGSNPCGSGTRVGDPYDISGTPRWTLEDSPATNDNSVPEPSSMLLAGLGLMMIAAARRKQKNAE